MFSPGIIQYSGIKLTVNYTKVTDNLSDFPVFVNPQDIISWMTLWQAQGIRIYDSSNNEIPREIVSKDEMWFKAPSLSKTVNTTFKIVLSWWSDYSASATYGREAVRADYRVVAHDWWWVDSTGNWYDWTWYWWITIWWDSTPIGKGTYFDGSNDYVDMWTWNWNSDTVTVQFRAKSQVSWQNILFTLWDDISNNNDRLSIHLPRTDGKIYRDYWNNTYNRISWVFWKSNTMERFTLRSNGNSWVGTVWMNIFYWATNQYSWASGKNLTANKVFYIWRDDKSSNFYRKWVLWDFRVTQKYLTNDRIATEYNNQSSPSTFYSIS